MNKSLSQKLNKFKTSPLIIFIAILEVIALICVSTFAWFIFAENNTVNTDIISVEPDSGLEIDFNNANENDYINIWNYLEEFQFEPVTSLDGRNLFIPTTGTFNAFAGDVSPDTPSSPENPGDTQNTYLIYFDNKGTGWDTPYIQCNFTYDEKDNIAMTRLNSTSTIYYYDLAPLIKKYNYALTYMKFKNGKGDKGSANITNMFGTEYNCIYSTLSANYLYKCKLDSNDKAIQGEQNNHHGLMVLEPKPYSGTVPDIGGGGTGNSGSGEGSGAVADKGGIKFREATVNDMNSKYINIDFTLTNTNPEDMPVYLSSRSFFKLYDPATDKEVNSKAIRMAFYQNDGSSGKITSSILSQEYEGEEPTEPVDPDDPGDTQSTYLVYFNKTGSNWSNVYIEADFTVETGTNRCLAMQPIEAGSNIYYIDLKKILDDHGSTNFTFMKFHNATSDNGNEYMSVQLPAGQINPDTMYSFKLDSSYKAYVGNLNGHNGLMLNDPVPYTGKVPDVGGDDDGNSGGNTDDPGDTTGDPEGMTTVFFNNTLGWEQPHAYIWQENASGDVELSDWPGKPMTHISGAVYYYTFNSKYDSIIFNDGNNQGGAVKTGDIYPVEDGHIYMIGAPTGDNEFGWTQEDYIGSVEGGTYPVISPGVSTGFQRPYAPVTQIDNNSGTSKVVIPAFASSIDDYNNGSGNPLFTIKADQTLSLSMIIWLEGTDPDCTEDVYAGKYIDMNLVFATPYSQGEEMYTYQFLDKTKENWIDDVIKTDTGVSFKPVVQLYDAENHKGYLMSVHDDEEGKPTIWQCRAPKDLSESEHIMFRRVNPMNEDEVWNYWDTNGFGGLSDSVKSADKVVLKDVVTFTAFADGSPTTALNEDGTHYDGAPEKSCGGLWGDHDTQLVTVYDGTNGQWIKNSEKEGTSSVLTMNFTYNGQQIEYKASSAYDKGMHYFIVPTKVYSKTNASRPPITFKRYFNFDGKYALNSDRNQLKYHMFWNADVCNGKFFEITEDNKGNKFSYWGSDILYVQAKKVVKSKFDDPESMMVVHFYSSDDNTTTSVGTNDFHSYIYKNSAYAPSDGGYGYACVIPSDRRYHYYRVERCKLNDYNEKWNVTPAQTIQYDSTTNNAHSNTVDKNICGVEYMYLKIYLECSTSYCGDKWDPEVYAWSSLNNNVKNADWPGVTMTWSSDTAEGGSTYYKQYYSDINISLYDRIIFSNDYDYDKQRRQTGDITIGTNTDVSGMIYQWDASNSKWLTTRKSGVNQKETLFVNLYDATGWDVNGS